ncbi:MAG: P-loop NTPase fold protein [Pseudomonadota bacterium]
MAAKLDPDKNGPEKKRPAPKRAPRQTESLEEQAAAMDESSTAQMAGSDPTFTQTGRVGMGGKPAIHVAKGLSPRGSGFALYSVDSAFSLGPLQEYVLREMRISEGQRSVLARSNDYIIYQGQEAPNPFMAAVVSLGARSSNSEMLLRSSLANLWGAVRNSVTLPPQTTLWVPLMGTGSAGLSHTKSAEIIRDLILNPQGLLPEEISSIKISLPKTITEENHKECLSIFGLPVAIHAPPPPPSEMPDRFHPDRPVSDVSRDDLGRDAIAAAVVTNVTSVWGDHKANDYPFAIHLSGRWGSGKSSVLSFLKARLIRETTHSDHQAREQKKGWIVADYNAWRMQNAGPAWWTLLTTVADQTYRDLGGRGRYLRLKDQIWRATRIARPWMIVAAVLLGLLSLYLTMATGDDITQTITTEKTQTTTDGDQTTKITNKEVDPIRSPNAFFGAGNAWAFIAAAITALGSIGALLKFLAGFTKSSTETAEAVRNLQSDPTAALKNRYEKIIKQTGRPVAVFIDDLDRCDAQFVVDLLESLQTAYADVPVLYVIASDRDWIVSAYNQVYKDFQPEISKPGAPLGFLFVKKIFQLAVPVPDLAGKMADTLTQALLRQEEAERPVSQSREARITSINEAAARGDTSTIAQIQKDALAEGQDITTELVQAVVNPQAQAAAAHQLLRYTKLFESTPRGVKRLINALTFRQGYILTAAQDIPFDTVTRWTILSLRFPYTADYLARHPEKSDKANRIKDDAPYFPQEPQIDEILKGLSTDDIAEVAAFG